MGTGRDEKRRREKIREEESEKKKMQVREKVETWRLTVFFQ